MKGLLDPRANQEAIDRTNTSRVQGPSLDISILRHASYLLFVRWVASIVGLE